MASSLFFIFFLRNTYVINAGLTGWGDVVLLNSAFALWVDGKVGSIQEGVEAAKEAIDSGKAARKLQEIIEVSQRLGEM